jgi:hypothetical protein
VSTVSNVPVAPKTVSPKSNITSGLGGAKSGIYAHPSSAGTESQGGRDTPPGVTPGPDAYHPNLAGNAPANPITNPGVIK